MKNKLLQKLFWPNLWVGVLSVLATLGVILMLVGRFIKVPVVEKIGFWLVLPLVTCGIFVAVIVFPYLIILKRRAKKQQVSAREHEE